VTSSNARTDKNRCPHTPRTSHGFSRCFLIPWWLFTATGISVFELLHPDDHALTATALTSVTGKEVGRLIDVRIQDAENRWRHCEIRGRSIDAEDGGDPSIIVGIRDTADRQGLEFGSGHTDLLRALVHHATSLLIKLDEDGCITSANAELTRLLGYDLGVVSSDELFTLAHASDQSSFRDALTSIDKSFSAAYTFVHTDGHQVVLDLRVTDLRTDPLINGFVVSGTDISDHKVTQNKLRHMADHDALTGVLNRRALLVELDNMARVSSDHEIVVLFCDLDGFKPVNDQSGHATGDEFVVAPPIRSGAGQIHRDPYPRGRYQAHRCRWAGQQDRCEYRHICRSRSTNP
jgi:PAS domain S-box-containing protein